MEQNEDQSPAIEEVLVAPPTEASLRLQVTDLLLRRPRDIRMAGQREGRATSCNKSKRRWKPTEATSTPPNTASEVVAVAVALDSSVVKEKP